MRHAVLLVAALSAPIVAGCSNEVLDEPPTGFSALNVLIADGSYDPGDTSYTPPTYEEAVRDRFHMSEDEARAFEEEENAIFKSRYGVDVGDPANADRLQIGRYLFEPRWGYRVVSMTGYDVPPEGWTVHDASYTVFVADPEGFVLGGDFEGMHVPPGPVALAGHYGWTTDDGEEIVLRYRTIVPPTMDAFGSGAWRCELESDTFGHGEGDVVTVFSQTDDGELSARVRNVQTFP